MDPKREPKRRNPAETRARILAAAFDLFASKGYARTGIREIALLANVASSLVVRYFGAKSALFEEALISAIYTRGFFIHEKKDFGEAMARLVVQDEDARLPAAMILAIADQESLAIARKVTKRIALQSLKEWLDEPEAEARALNMLVLLNGFTIQTRHLMTGEIPPQSIRWLARSLQAIVDEGSEAKSVYCRS